MNKMQMIQQLSSVPNNLIATYERIFEQSHHQDKLMILLQWLAYSKRDMTVKELAEVAAVDFSSTECPVFNPERRSIQPADILKFCYGLVTEVNGGILYRCMSYHTLKNE